MLNYLFQIQRTCLQPYYFYTYNTKLPIFNNSVIVGKLCFGTYGPLLRWPAWLESYHGLTKNRREITLALSEGTVG